MLNKIVLPALTAALMVLVLPSEVDAYGAAHVGYTHVGPNGAYHYGATAASGPRGVAAAGHTTAYGAYPAGHAGAAGYGGAAYGRSYHYTPSYGGGAAVGGARYGYVR